MTCKYVCILSVDTGGTMQLNRPPHFSTDILLAGSTLVGQLQDLIQSLRVKFLSCKTAHYKIS